MAGQGEDDLPIINASDISRFVFCRRAWWYDRQGYAPANEAEFRRGRRLHLRFDLVVRGVQLLAVLAVLLLISGVFLAAFYFLQLAAGAG
jgi:hypothetical protein